MIAANLKSGCGGDNAMLIRSENIRKMHADHGII